MRLGYTLMSEQSGPRELVVHAAGAERAGFDFEVISDHYFPWLDEMGHSPYAWSVLGAVTQVTDRVELMTYVTCPLMRYHPAVVAQKAATVDLLSDGRFTLGLGAGENLNEHVVGRGWPPVNVRHEMLEEALTIINALFDGGYVDFAGDHYRVDSAKVWDLPQNPRARSASPSRGSSRSRPSRGLADHLIAVEPEAELVHQWDQANDKPPLAQDRPAAGLLGRRPRREHRPRPRAVPVVRRRLEGQRRAARHRRLRRRLAVRHAATTSPTRSRAAPISRRSSRRSGSSRTPASPTSRSSRSATSRSTTSWRSPRRSSCPRCGAEPHTEPDALSGERWPSTPRRRPTCGGARPRGSRSRRR